MIQSDSREATGLPRLPIFVGFLLFCLATASVILGMTPWTYQLDDIKIVLQTAGGGVLLAYWFGLWALRLVEDPPKVIWIPYAAYLGACLLSVLVAKDFVHWIGWQYMYHYTALLGFVLMGAATIRTRRMVEWVLKFWVALSLITTIFGLFHYAGGFESLERILFPRPPQDGGVVYALIVTFKNARSMLSTILNTQFFGNFLLMVIPVQIATMLVAYNNLRRKLGERMPLVTVLVSVFWLAASALAVALSVTCIFATFAKSSTLLILPLLAVFVVGLVYVAGIRVRDFLAIPYLHIIVLLVGIAAVTVLALTWGDFVRQFRGLEENLGPRRIIFGGAWSMFLDNFFTGGGPGSFRLLFPEYRTPDYHLTRISNLTLYAHNWILDLLAETGILGFAAYMSFLGGVLYIGWKGAHGSTDFVVRVAVLGSIVGAMSVLAGSLSTPMTRWPVGAVSLAAMLGTAVGISLVAGRTEAEPTGARNPLSLEWNGMTYLRLTAFIFAAIFAMKAYSFTKTFFQASMKHNTGLQISDYATARLGFTEAATDPRIAAMYNEGIKYFNEALEIDPTLTTTYYKLAHAYNRVLRQEEALAVYEALREYAPHYSELHYNLGVVYYNIANDRAAQARKALAEKEADAFSKAWGESMELFEKSLAEMRIATAQSNKVTAHYIRGMITLKYAETVDNPARQKELAVEAAEVLWNVKDLPISTVIQEKGQARREEGEKFEALRIVPRAWDMAGEHDKAAESTLYYYARNPTSPWAFEKVVEFQLKAGKTGDALAFADEALARNPLDGAVRVQRAVLLKTLGRMDEAAEEARLTLTLDEELTAKGSPLLNARQQGQLEKLQREIAVAGGAG